MRQSPFVTALLLAAVLLLAAATARAQALPPQGMPPEALADALIRGLSDRVALTPEEHAAMRPILVAQIAKRQTMVRSELAARPGAAGLLALRGKLRVLDDETDAQLRTVLPPAKLAALQQYRREQREHARARLAAARSTS